jgi:hypothetical protein
MDSVVVVFAFCHQVQQEDRGETRLSVLSALENSAMLRYHCLVVPIEAPLTTIMAPAESLPVCVLLGSTD